MRYPPEDQDEIDEALAHGAEPWMFEQLRRNWGYLGWGPHEDYMIDGGPGGRMAWASWSTFSDSFTLGEWPDHHGDRSGGEVVGWYFEIDGASLNLVLWVINPRLGQSYGATVERVRQAELAEERAEFVEEWSLDPTEIDWG